jgi:hypothetical protein
VAEKTCANEISSHRLKDSSHYYFRISRLLHAKNGPDSTDGGMLFLLTLLMIIVSHRSGNVANVIVLFGWAAGSELSG